MAHQLLFYDTKEKDLARDLQDLLAELDLKVAMIPRSPDRGMTLDAKERAYLLEASGAIFLITPGASRDGKSYPSPSVSDEMGQSKQRFKDKPESLIYLVDSACAIQAVDQQSYIQFDRTSMRSVLEALTQLIRDLKVAGAFRQQKIEPRQTPGVDVRAVAARIRPELKRILIALSEKPNGVLILFDFDRLLKETLGMKEQDANFAKRDLQLSGLVTYVQQTNHWALTGLGWEVVRIETERMREEFRRALESRKFVEAVEAVQGLIDRHKAAQKPQPRRDRAR